VQPRGPVRQPYPTRFLAPIDCLKIPAQHSVLCGSQRFQCRSGSDPAFYVNADPDLDLDPEIWWPKNEKFYSWKKVLLFLWKLIWLSLGFREGRPSHRWSLQPVKIQFFNKYISSLFSFFVVIFPRIRIRIQPIKINTHPCGYGTMKTLWNVAFAWTKSTSMGFCLIPAYNVLEQFPNLREEKLKLFHKYIIIGRHRNIRLAL
jgi:hypothetical protein